MNKVDTIIGEADVQPICKFYVSIYKRMIRWFGYTRPFWLCDMDEQELLKCILNLVMKPNMYIVFINVAVKIRKNNNRSVDVLMEYKQSKKSPDKLIKRRQYYADNIVRLREYNRTYQNAKKLLCSINIFRKSPRII